MSRVRVAIDLNSRDTAGLTPARLRRASGPLHVGQIVTAYEPEDGVQALAYVSEVDERLGYAFLHVNMATMRDDAPEGPLDFSRENRASAAARNAHAEHRTRSRMSRSSTATSIR